MSLVQQAQHIIKMHLLDGDIAVDATVGNGHDTLFLAQCVGNSGKVYGFDIQQNALDICYQRLDEHQLTHRVSLIHAGHETIPIVLPTEICNAGVKAVMFNLGYLPGGDKNRTTQTSTTLAALSSAAQILAPEGIISIIAYTGHPGGQEEYESVRIWAQRLADDIFVIDIQDRPESNKPSPVLIVIRKK